MSRTSPSCKLIRQETHLVASGSQLANSILFSSSVAETLLGLSHCVWLYRTRRYRASAATLRMTFDQLAESYRAQGRPFLYAASEKWVLCDADKTLDSGPQPEARPPTSNQDDDPERGAVSWSPVSWAPRRDIPGFSEDEDELSLLPDFREGDVQLQPLSPAPAHTRSARVSAVRLPYRVSYGNASGDLHPLAPSPEEFV